jgi:hypothetical protein
MRPSKIIFASILALALGAGCIADGELVADDGPPPARAETFVVRPGFVWIGGCWTRSYDRWTWSPGHYVAERPDFVYVNATWARRGHRWEYVPGRWEGRGRAEIKARGRR